MVQSYNYTHYSCNAPAAVVHDGINVGDANNVYIIIH